MEKQAQLTQNPSIESIYPSEPAAPIPPKPSVSEAPTITPERQPVTASSGKLAPSVRPPTPAQTPPEEQPSAIREKPKPNAAPRERPQRGVSIRTNRYGTNQHAKGAAKNTCIKNRCKAGTEISYTGCTAKNAPKEQQPGYQSSRRSREKAGRSRGKGGQGADKRLRQFGWRHGAFCRVFHRHCCGGVFGFSVGDSLC